MNESKTRRQLRIAIEGFDGSGKTTLVRGLLAQCEEMGVACQVVGRKGTTATPDIWEVTEKILKWDAGEITVSADENARARLGRARARMDLAEASQVDLVLFDRWLPSDLSRLPEDAQERYAKEFSALHRDAAIDLTIYLSADFEILWERIAARPKKEWSPSELLGSRHMQDLYRRYIKVWSAIWNEGRVQIDAAHSADMVLADVLLTFRALVDDGR